MDMVSYRFMIRNNDNHLMMFRNLFHQYVVDMYAKTESERLRFITTHQKQLRSDSDIHLRDAINNVVVGADIGQICILPSTFTASPRYMQERTKDAMTYLHADSWET
ncbi:hypothetical protein AVEN_142006-1 [Araneus ventricosus]|uniref:Helitron helicase-like domain-containing protein n=1 Tax=Araneus ventricosus TaxID=182803 RepID=A0A4Y2P5P0_ARAVE|nr:hypothetical protein AVEN_142006-1 [Araneus ventricosus]